MGKRLNPPPGWPEPPPGWKPPPGWRPDPSWPDPPEGWQLWINEGVSTGRKILLGVGASAVLLFGGCTAVALTTTAPSDPAAAPTATEGASSPSGHTNPSPDPTTKWPVERETTSATPEREETSSDVPGQAQEVRVARIVDGDTLEVAALTAGAALSSTSQVDVRLLQIDTPETKDPSEPVQCYGKEATEALRQLVPPGSTAWVQRD